MRRGEYNINFFKFNIQMRPQLAQSPRFMLFSTPDFLHPGSGVPANKAPWHNQIVSLQIAAAIPLRNRILGHKK